MTVINIFLALEVILLSWFLVSIPRICFGNIAGIFAVALLMLSTAYYHAIFDYCSDLWASTFGRIALITVTALMLAAIIYLIILTILMIKSRTNYPKDKCTVIVLGCWVKNGRPTRMLRRRLDAAYDYLCRHPESYCILSGGKGDDEIISEAEAMRRYLLGRGISCNRLINEDRSTCTRENLAFSMKIIKDLGLSSQVAIVTDGFHQFRAKLIAKQQGIESYAISAHTEPRYIFIYWVREWIAITAIFIKLIMKRFF